MLDVLVVGAGPNGLAAAITLAEAGCSVRILEAAESVGGGCRTAELTLPGFRHDICSAVHPLALASPFFRSLALDRYGLEWVQPDAPLAHPLDDEEAVLLERSLDATAEGLGADGKRWSRLFGPFLEAPESLLDEVLRPVHVPRHPLTLARFGASGLLPATLLARLRFRGERAKALFAGLAAHSLLPLQRPPSASFGLLLGLLAHAVGWPIPRGGAQAVADALAAQLRSLGGEIEAGRRVDTLAELPEARVTLLDVSAAQLLALAGDRLPARYRRGLARFRPGPGVYKLDLALAGPIPWRDPACARAATVHVGGTLAEIAEAERQAAEGRASDRPFVLLVQPTLFDPSRAPAGRHTAWAYCHVPNGSDVDMTEAIEAQIERFAPGFRKQVLARHVFAPADLEQYNPNYAGGDISGGLLDLRQLVARPVLRLVPYATPVDGLYLCSASTPPGSGVHGMCGYWAARAALRRSLSVNGRSPGLRARSRRPD